MKLTLQMLFVFLLHVAALLPADLNYAFSAHLGSATLPSLLSRNLSDHKNHSDPLSLFSLGISLYHVFWFDLAHKAFQLSTQIDPSFYMGYWGEALSLKYPLWATEHTNEAWHTLSKIPNNTTSLNQLEQSLIYAAKTYLNPSENKLSREINYADEMKIISTTYPDDPDLAALYGLSVLAISGNSTEKQQEADKILSSYLLKFPHHRGLLHYKVHAYVSLLLIIGSSSNCTTCSSGRRYTRQVDPTFKPCKSHAVTSLSQFRKLGQSNRI